MGKKLYQEKLNFNVSSYMKDIIGRDLITSDIIAIFELVKNSYDANAKNVYIKIFPEEDIIIIADDGCGMSYDDIKNKWLFVAYSEKVEDTKKAYAGSKGIGRFSADRLGEKLRLRSKKEDVISEIIVDWELFQKDQKEEFTSVEIDYYQLTNDDFLDKYKTGTIIEISHLRDSWDETKIKKTEKGLAALINPINNLEEFKITIEYKDKKSGFSNIVENPIKEILLEKTASINVLITKDIIDIKLKDSGEIIYKVKLKNYTLLDNINFLIYFMNRKAKVNFTRLMNEPVVQYGNVFIYKNNFRVMPYGEINYDIFNLNLRKSQGYNRYLGLRELLGWISITDTSNKFKEASSRDAGLIKNNYYFALEEAYIELVQRPLEDYVQLVNFGNIDIDDVYYENEINQIDRLIKRFSKHEIIEIEKYELPPVALDVSNRIKMLDSPEISDDVKEEIKKNLGAIITNLTKEKEQYKLDKDRLDREKNKLKHELNVKTNIILKEKPLRQSFLEHELRKISNDMKVLNIRINSKINNETRKQISSYLAKYKRLADKLVVIQQIVLRVDNNTKVKKQAINLNSYITTYFKNFLKISDIKASVYIDENIEVIQNIDIFDLGVLIDNIVINAEDQGATKLMVTITENGLSFLSNTPSIKIHPTEKVFELGYSTKENGLGMGLYIVKQISEEFNWEISVENITDNLVAFIFKFKEKVNENRN